jgi:hypothetical protein
MNGIVDNGDCLEAAIQETYAQDRLIFPQHVVLELLGNIQKN